MAGAQRPANPDQIRRRALAIARVLKFRPDSYAGRERQAYHIMSHLAGMPMIKDKSRRRTYGNEVLQNSNRLLPQDHPHNVQFSWRLREVVASMQEFPAWHANLVKSDSALVNDYLNLKLIVDGMNLAGMGGLAGISGDVVKGGLQGGQRAAAGGTARIGNIVGGGLRGAQGAVTGGLAGSLGLVWVVGSVALVAVQQRMADVGNELTRRYQEKRLSEALYQRAFGKDVPMPEQFLAQVR